ncbi:hypothetical protein [Sulfurimonas indica]|uniref:hypothetical protein n=1 Tax=Sulfurimonas TaxID=202746 RepID=UPI00126564BF|nr:hypothetical protein [Sulfurimonas indica]
MNISKEAMKSVFCPSCNTELVYVFNFEALYCQNCLMTVYDLDNEKRNKIIASYEITKCNHPDINISICRNCKRSAKSNDGNYEQFNLRKTLMHGMQCDGYTSKSQDGAQ